MFKAPWNFWNTQYKNTSNRQNMWWNPRSYEMGFGRDGKDSIVQMSQVKNLYERNATSLWRIYHTMPTSILRMLLNKTWQRRLSWLASSLHSPPNTLTLSLLTHVQCCGISCLLPRAVSRVILLLCAMAKKKTKKSHTALFKHRVD